MRIRFRSIDDASGSEMSSDVIIEARVQSVASCDLSRVDILVHGLTDNALYGIKVSKLQVQVHTLGVDGFDINTSM